jgi:hypothetical protein
MIETERSDADMLSNHMAWVGFIVVSLYVRKMSLTCLTWLVRAEVSVSLAAESK